MVVSGEKLRKFQSSSHRAHHHSQKKRHLDKIKEKLFSHVEVKCTRSFRNKFVFATEESICGDFENI